MDPWIRGSAAGAAAGAVAGAAASAATVCTYYVIIGGALRALLYLHDKVHTVAAEASAPAAAPAAALAAALAAAPAADTWIHGSISFIMNHIFYYEPQTRKIKNLQTAEKSRGWLEIERFLDQIDRVGANFFSKSFRTNERMNKQTNCTKNFLIFF